MPPRFRVHVTDWHGNERARLQARAAPFLCDFTLRPGPSRCQAAAVTPTSSGRHIIICSSAIAAGLTTHGLALLQRLPGG